MGEDRPSALAEGENARSASGALTAMTTLRYASVVKDFLTRVIPGQVDAYPARRRYRAHSCEVNAARADALALHRVSAQQAAALLTSAVSLANTISIRLKSGDKARSSAPRASIAARALAPLLTPERQNKPRRSARLATQNDNDPPATFGVPCRVSRDSRRQLPM